MARNRTNLKPATKQDPRQEKAWRAVREFTKMIPTFTSFARMITGRNDIVVRTGKHGAETDGRVIYIAPPMALGEDYRHVSYLCGKRHPNKRQMCEACDARETALWYLYHEIAHIAGGSATKPTTYHQRKIADLIDEWHPAAACNHARKMKAGIADAKDPLNLAILHNGFLSTILKSIEDSRVDSRMFRVRPGLRPMFHAGLNRIFEDGYEMPDGAVVHWRDKALNAQVIIGCLLIANGFDAYTRYLSEEAQAFLADEQLVEICRRGPLCHDVHQALDVSIEVWLHLQTLGLCHVPKCEVPPPQPPVPPQSSEPEDSDDSDDSGDPQDGEDDNNSDDSDGTGDSGSGSNSGDPGESTDEQEDQSGADAQGESSDFENDESDSDGDDQQEGDPDLSPDDSDVSDDGDDDLGGRSSDGSEETEDPDDDDPGDGDDQPSQTQGDELVEDPPEDNDASTGSAGGDSDSDEEDSPEESDDASDDTALHGTGDIDGESFEEEEGSLEGDDDASSSGELSSPWQQDDSQEADQLDDEADVPEVKGEAVWDEENPQEPVVRVVEDAGDPDVVAEQVDGFGGHSEEGVDKEFIDGEHEEDDSILARLMKMDREAIERAVKQALWFDRPSESITGVDVLTFPHSGVGWRDVSYYVPSQFMPGESVIGSALMKARIVFAENKRAHETRHLKSGRIDARVLGKRAPIADPRLFKKKVLPGKRDYFVLIGIDCSGSNNRSNRIERVKRAVFGQTEVLQRLGVKFAVYAHSGGFDPNDLYNWGQDVDEDLECTLWILEIKSPDEPWAEKQQRRLACLQPTAENYDGHTLEYYRKLVEQRTETDRILMYYTDGAMPAANYDEELVILQSEIAECRKRRIKLTAVGINTDSPKQYGFDTVQVDSDDDLHLVISQLERLLTQS